MPRFVMKSKYHRGVKYVTENTNRHDLIFQRDEYIHCYCLGMTKSLTLVYMFFYKSTHFDITYIQRSLSEFAKKIFKHFSLNSSNVSLNSYVVKDYTPIWEDTFFNSAISKCNNNAGCA